MRTVNPLSEQRGVGPWPVRVWKDMQVCQRKVAEKGFGLREMQRRLTWKPDDEIGANRGMGKTRTNLRDEAGIERCRVRPPHRPKYLVRPMLQRQVEVRRQSGRRGDEIDDLRRAIHRLE